MSDLKVGELPLGEVAHRRIRTDILACRLAPGQRLTERGLAAELGMGISPIRDALTRLDHEGLVRTMPRKGYQVKPLTIMSVDKLFEFWTILGPELARRGVSAASAAQLEQAVACADELSQLREDEGDIREVALRGEELSSRLFHMLADFTGNEYLINAYNQTTSELSRVWTLVIDSQLLEAGRPLGPFDEWRDAAIRRDAEAIAELTRRHIDQGHTRVLRTLARWPSVINSEVVPLRGAPSPAD